MDMFETIVIFKPDNIIANKEMQKYELMIQNWNKTKKVKTEGMGIKNLAYEMKKKYKQGYYAIFTYQCDSIHIEELERHLRIDEDVLKFMTVKNNELPELEDYIPEEVRVNRNKNIDALDVLLGIDNYIKKEAV